MLVDFGIMGRIGPGERLFLAEILKGFLERDYKRVSEVHFEAGYVPANHSMDDFAQALRSVGEPIFGKDATDVSMARVLLQLFDITRQFGMHLRPELILLQKTMVQVEGVARVDRPRPQHLVRRQARRRPLEPAANSAPKASASSPSRPPAKRSLACAVCPKPSTS